MHTRPHLAHRAAALAAAVSLCAAPAAVAAPQEDPPPPSVIGGERLGLPGVQVSPLDGAPRVPGDLSAQSWIVADAASGEVLAASNAHRRLAPASTLKILFADTVLPKFDRSLVHRVDPSELMGIGQGSSLVGIKEDLDYRVEDLWRGVFLSSGNDAVHVLAHMNGGVQETVTEMQTRAEQLQAHDTRVISPDGYDQDGQLSSAYDLTLFARAGLRNPDFRAYCATRDAQFPGAFDKNTGQRGSFGIANTDRLLGKYPGLIGVKNGFTTNAGSTFVGAAERDGRTLLVTVMHPTTYQKVYDETAELLDWGFAAAGKVTPVGKLVEEKAAKAPPSASPSPAASASASTPPAGHTPVAGQAGGTAGERPGRSDVAQAPPPAGSTGPGPAGWLAITVGLAAAAFTAARLLLRRGRRSPGSAAPAAAEPEGGGTGRRP
ncbi:D-alanyl-D-alanine carboxypeptidase family protein [Kitasatospora sp. NPDC050543]|uniref:D-alanyl-D-alanine carboxypeptidase family protein n=1 Tax=Kitasatospora sp. NPDC050543 TaxID=3364054 RepID=UPI0037BD2ED2